jgi:hypothetical protein
MGKQGLFAVLTEEYQAIIMIVENMVMKKLILSQLQNEIKAKGIPKFSEKLKAQSGYDADARKQRLNPEELRFIKLSLSGMITETICLMTSFI